LIEIKLSGILKGAKNLKIVNDMTKDGKIKIIDITDKSKHESLKKEIADKKYGHQDMILSRLLLMTSSETFFDDMRSHKMC